MGYHVMHEDYSQAVLTTIDSPVIATDKDFLIQYCNKKAEEVFGVGTNAVKGSSINELMDSIGCEIPWEQIKTALLTNKNWQGKLCLKKPADEILCLDVVFSPAKNKAGDVVGFTGIYRETNDNNHVDTSRVKEHQLNDLKNRFVSMASHEFRTPLSTILSSAFLLEKYTTAEQQPIRLKHARKIRESVMHMNELLDDFLSIGKLEEGKTIVTPSPFNLKELIAEIITELQPLKKQGQEIVSLCDSIKPVTADKKLVKNIITNLLSNALKFSASNKSVWLNILHSNDSITVRVKDQGIGISSDDRQHLFEIFHRGKNVQNIQGTGLGLHIVKRYLELLNGSIHINSELGSGTEVTVNLPISEVV